MLSIIRLIIVGCILLFSLHAYSLNNSNLFSDSLLHLKNMKLVSDPIVSCDSFTAVIPFTKAGNLILVKATADGVVGNFILDTGAPGLVLNLSYFRELPAIASFSQEQGGITGSIAAADPTLINSFSFGPIKYSNVEADRINLGHLENSKGVRILGLLGLNLFSRFEMIINYEESILYFHLIGKKEVKSYNSSQLDNTAEYDVLPILIRENKLLTTATMEGKKLTFLIDTGAETNVIDSRLPDKIFDNVSVTGRILLSGTGSKKTEALSGNLKNLKLGKIDIGTLPVIVTNLEKMCTAFDRCLDGMLGFDFLSLHKIGFNFVTRKMYIWK